MEDNKVAYKSSIDTQVRGFYFAASGDDAFSGETVEVPKQTIQSAIDATQLLDPPPAFGNIATVTAAQGGIFNESIVLAESVQFEGESTVLNLSAPVAVTLDSFLNCSLTSVTNFQSNGISFKIDGKTSTGLDVLANRVFASNATGLAISGNCDSIFVTISQFSITGTGSTAIKITSTSGTPIDINCNTVNLGGSNTVFLDHNPQSADDLTVVNVSSITDIQVTRAKTAGSKGIICREGHLIVEASSIEASTVFECLGGISHLQVGDLIGNVAISGGRATLESACLTGDITIAAGATLDAIIVEFTGTITNNGTLNGLIGGEPFGTYRQKHEEQVVLNASSFSDQVPSGTDSLMQIEFGAAQGTGSDPVEMDASGSVTINRSDQYNLSLVVEFGRTGASGSFALIFFRILIDGVQFGDSRSAQLDNPNGAFPVQFAVPLDLLATQVLTAEFWRDSSGFDAGSLLSKTPTLGGTNPAPSASIILTINRLVQPVD